MFSKKLTAVLIIATALAGLSAAARAAEGTQDDFMPLFKMQMVDKNKDGMVSKKEFMAMMDKAYDMKAKALGCNERHDDRSTDEGILEISVRRRLTHTEWLRRAWTCPAHSLEIRAKRRHLNSMAGNFFHAFQRFSQCQERRRITVPAGSGRRRRR